MNLLSPNQSTQACIQWIEQVHFTLTVRLNCVLVSSTLLNPLSTAPISAGSLWFFATAWFATWIATLKQLHPPNALRWAHLLGPGCWSKAPHMSHMSHTHKHAVDIQVHIHFQYKYIKEWLCKRHQKFCGLLLDPQYHEKLHTCQRERKPTMPRPSLHPWGIWTPPRCRMASPSANRNREATGATAITALGDPSFFVTASW